MRVVGACWLTPQRLKPGQYARIRTDDGRPFVHRVIYEALVGPTAGGIELDHLCRNTACVNPWHLEPVTHAENVRRGAAGLLRPRPDRCRNGHLYTAETTRWSKDGRHRDCRVCQRESQRRYRARKTKEVGQ